LLDRAGSSAWLGPRDLSPFQFAAASLQPTADEPRGGYIWIEGESATNVVITIVYISENVAQGLFVSHAKPGWLK
jgi:hypothetical protein